MNRKALVSGIVLLHGAAVLSLMTLSGCQTGRMGHETPPSPVLPPSSAPVAAHTPDVLLPPPPPSAETMSQTPAPISETTTIVVQKGETLSHIASRYGMTWRELADLNAITDPNKVRAGQKLMIPGNLTPVAPSSKPAPSHPKAKAGPGDAEYTVKPGDSLWKICRDNKVKEADLRQANHLEGDRIRVGQKLVIPGGAGRVSAPAPAPAPTPKPQPKAPTPTVTPPPVPFATEPTAETAPAATTAPALMPDVPAAAPATTTPDSSQSFTYTVKPGDTLESIAKTYVMFPEELLKYNPDINPANLTPGTKIVIPLVP